MSKEIPLTQGYVAIVDDEDYDKLIKYKWQASVKPKTVRAQRHGPRDSNGKRKTILMHREILGDGCRGLDVDHRNHNTLDNRRSNLRACTHAENLHNQRTQGRPKSSRYKGVYFHKAKSKYQAQIKHHSKRIYLGYFDSEEEAARAYNKAALIRFGAFAYLNNVGGA